jgi:hypothetical protein
MGCDVYRSSEDSAEGFAALEPPAFSSTTNQPPHSEIYTECQMLPPLLKTFSNTMKAITQDFKDRGANWNPLVFLEFTKL